MSTESQVAAAALDTLQGARGLPGKEAADLLRDFLNSMRSSKSDNLQAADATAALEKLVRKLDAGEPASDDDWQSSIETMLSLANAGSGYFTK